MTPVTNRLGSLVGQLRLNLNSHSLLSDGKGVMKRKKVKASSSVSILSIFAFHAADSI